MNRRQFIGQGAGCLGSAWLVEKLAYAGAQQPASKLKIPYIRDKIPEFEVPPYRGEWYEDTIPDTLDLTERLRLAAHSSTSIADPLARDEVFWLVDFLRNPPTMMHDFNDWVLQLEGLVEGLPLARLASGSTENEDVDRVWMAGPVLGGIGSDGLLYVPMNGRPWSRLGFEMPDEWVFRRDGSKVPVDDPSVAQIGSAYTCQRVIPAMTLYYLRDQNPMWKASIEQMIQRLSQLAVYRDDYAFYPDGMLEPNASYDPHAAMPIGIRSIEWGGNGRLIQALAQYYAVTGYEPAIKLAAKITRYLQRQSQYFTEDGSWLISDMERTWLNKYFDLANLKQGGHGHAHAIGLLSVLEYGLAANDRGAIDFARGGLDWGKANGVSLIGFFPEFYVPGYHTCETDTISDMLGLAVKLSASGIADYWDDVDRWVRNQFAEQQLTSVDAAYRAAERSPRKPVQFNEIGENVPERNLGAFAGWAAPNDFAHRYLGTEFSIMHCCMGNGARALYYVWEHILVSKDGQLRVNLLLNRASGSADVYSHLPYEGKVEVKIKKSHGALAVRVPEWIESGSSVVKAARGGQPVPLVWNGRYVRTGAVNAGDLVVLTFPIATRTQNETIAGVPYTLEIRGNTVVSMSPGGENMPLYRREYLRADKAPSVKVKRFVAEQSVLW
jgi:Beta-L-arabinofuranosidase, GH127